MKNNIAGLILAGGKNSRMAGRKKIFLDYRGKNFYEWIRAGLPDSIPVYLSVETYAPYEALDAVLVKDIYKDIGPVGGIHAGLKQCREEALLVVPCDMMPVPEEILKKLLKKYAGTKRPVCPVIRGRDMPLPALYTKEMLLTLEEMIRNNNYRLSDVWRKTAVYETIELEMNTLQNVNTEEEYKALKGETEWLL